MPKPLKVPSLARSVPKPLSLNADSRCTRAFFNLRALKVPSLARSVPKPLKVPSLARSVPKPLKEPSLARSVLKPFIVGSVLGTTPLTFSCYRDFFT